MSYELFFIGLVVTLAFIGITGYFPGGIIVPAYMVLFVDQPLRLFGTLVIAVLSWALYRLASKYLILFGKRRFIFLILTGATGAFLLSYILPQFFPGTVELKVIGWVIPGLIASQFEKQGPAITLSAMAIVLTILYFTGKLFYLIF